MHLARTSYPARTVLRYPEMHRVNINPRIIIHFSTLRSLLFSLLRFFFFSVCFSRRFPPGNSRSIGSGILGNANRRRSGLKQFSPHHQSHASSLRDAFSPRANVRSTRDQSWTIESRASRRGGAKVLETIQEIFTDRGIIDRHQSFVHFILCFFRFSAFRSRSREIFRLLNKSGV